MRTCPQCGAQTQDTDDFCGVCGTYLGWQEETARQPPDGDLGPVLPGKPNAPRPLRSTQASTQAVTTVDGPPCPVCGTTNSSGRSFCRQCGTALTSTTAAAASKRRWRWWFGRGDTGKWLRRLAALVLLIVLVIAGIMLFPFGRDLYEDVRDKLGKTAAIAPTGAVATAEVPGHPAAAAVDGLSNRYWGAAAVGDSIEFTFRQPFRLLSVVVHVGAATDREHFDQQARPTAIDLTATSSDGQTRSLPLTVADQPGPQRTDMGISDVVRVRLAVRATAGLTQGKHIALGEVEFFQRS